MTSFLLSKGLFRLLLASVMITAGTTVLMPSDCPAGPYTTSAHGDSGNGVDSRADGYAKGNCGHCHEKHASVEGSEPAPVDGEPSAFLLFTENFDTSQTTGSYQEADNMCFACHRGTGSSFQQVTNYDYARTFGGYTDSSVDNILDTFNQGSYHNLYDVWKYTKDNNDKFPFFTEHSNPCAACHNPHLAKRNNATPSNPTNTSISLPSDHDNLWGDGGGAELMSQYTTYRAPYRYDGSTYEPAGATDFATPPTQTPDYNTFCLDCHGDAARPVYSTTRARNLTTIDWSSSGDYHGENTRADDPSCSNGTIISPYSDATVQSNYVLSCLDCHEPHGTPLSRTPYLLRKEANGRVVPTGLGASTCGPGSGDFCQEDFCLNCHTHTHGYGPDGCFDCHVHGAVGVPCPGVPGGMRAF